MSQVYTVYYQLKGNLLWTRMSSFVPSTPTSAAYWDLQWKSKEGFDITKSTAPSVVSAIEKFREKKLSTQLAKMSLWYQQLLLVRWARIERLSSWERPHELPGHSGQVARGFTQLGLKTSKARDCTQVASLGYLCLCLTVLTGKSTQSVSTYACYLLPSHPAPV